MVSSARVGIATAALLGAACVAYAEKQDAKPDDTRAPPEAPAGMQIRYVPPDLGAPEVRVSGGTRGAAGDGLSVRVVAPAQTGLTIQEQPTLYWYNSGTARTGVRVSIVADSSSQTVLDMQLPGIAEPGIHPFRLRDTKVRLAMDTDYQWSVTAIQSQNPSENIVASGMIRRVRGSGGAQVRLTADAAVDYARSGLWYDAMQALSEAIRVRPNEAVLRQERSDLLSQVGLTDVAAWDSSAIR
jgi:Domain of Unknown Function (DUF928)